jgi:hypothetical protein
MRSRMMISVLPFMGGGEVTVPAVQMKFNP